MPNKKKLRLPTIESEKKSVAGPLKKDQILGVVFFGTAIFILISLVSFNPLDVPFYTSTEITKVKNLAGIFGARIGWFLLFTVGITAYLVPLLLFIWGLELFAKVRPHRFNIKFLCAILFLLSTCSFLSIIFSDVSTTRFQKGGVLGLLISDFLIRYFGYIGAGLITMCFMCLTSLASTNFMILSLFANTIVFLKRSFLVLAKRFRSSIAHLRSSRQKIKGIPETFRTQQVSPTRKEGVGRATVQQTKPEAKEPAIFISETQPKPIQPRISSHPEQKVKEKLKPTPLPKPKPVGSYKLPGIDLLDSPPPLENRQIAEDIKENSKILEETLADFGVEVQVARVDRGPTITRYELEPASGVKVNRITALSDDIALAMKAQSVRIVAPIPGKGTVGVEVPNRTSAMVYLREVLESEEFQYESSKLLIALGKDISGSPIVADLAEMPHLLIAGTTGSGKTVCVNSIITSILFNSTPDEVKFLMVDPKMVELAIFNDIPHLLCPVVIDAKKVSSALEWVVNEMDRRYRMFARAGARNIEIYNEKIREGKVKKEEGIDNIELPYIVVIIDELADLMAVSRQEIEDAIMRLAHLSRAVGIHMILATQRPSVDVITGVIKANFPARISFKVASKVDSRTVLDTTGADKLLGRGDMLFIEPGATKPIRAQGSLVTDSEIERVVGFIKSQRGTQYSEEILAEVEKKIMMKQFEKDEIYDEAVRVILESGQASVSILQRRLGLGYTRAARIIDMMEKEGIVGPYQGSKPRKILVDKDKT